MRFSLAPAALFGVLLSASAASTEVDVGGETGKDSNLKMIRSKQSQVALAVNADGEVSEVSEAASSNTDAKAVGKTIRSRRDLQDASGTQAKSQVALAVTAKGEVSEVSDAMSFNTDGKAVGKTIRNRRDLQGDVPPDQGSAVEDPNAMYNSLNDKPLDELDEDSVFQKSNDTSSQQPYEKALQKLTSSAYKKINIKGGQGKWCRSTHAGDIKCDLNSNYRSNKITQFTVASGGTSSWHDYNTGKVKVALKNYRGKWCADEGGTIKCNRNGIGSWEKFTLSRTNPQWQRHSRVALHGAGPGFWFKYCADEKGTIKCNRCCVGGWEQFTVDHVPYQRR